MPFTVDNLVDAVRETCPEIAADRVRSVVAESGVEPQAYEADSALFKALCDRCKAGELAPANSRRSKSGKLAKAKDQGAIAPAVQDRSVGAEAAETFTSLDPLEGVHKARAGVVQMVQQIVVQAEADAQVLGALDQVYLGTLSASLREQGGGGNASAAFLERIGDINHAFEPLGSSSGAAAPLSAAD